MVAPVIPTLPPAPSRADDGATFSAKADAFAAALPGFGMGANDLGDYLDDLAIEVEADRANAALSAGNALVSETNAQGFATLLNAEVPGFPGSYSAREWATGQVVPMGSAKEWATLTNTTVDGDFSAKEWAIGTAVEAGSAKDWAVGDGIIAEGKKSALAYASEAFDSALTALNAPGTNATSITSNSITTGSKTFQIQMDKALVAGQFVVISYALNVTQYMVGQITSYNPMTGVLVVNVTQVNGMGTFANWIIALTALAAANSNNITTTNENLTYYPVLVSGTGAQALRIDDVTTPFSYNPSTGVFTLTEVLAMIATFSSVLNIPSGNTAARPMMPMRGSFRENTQLGIEYYNGTQWQTIGGAPDFLLMNAGVI